MPLTTKYLLMLSDDGSINGTPELMILFLTSLIAKFIYPSVVRVVEILYLEDNALVSVNPFP